MSELIELLGNPAHWGFEIISGGVIFVGGLIVPERLNPFKRLVTRHDRDKHGIHPDDREARMARLDAWLDELDREYGPPSEEALERARAAFGR